MKRLSLPPVFSGFLATFLMLFSLAAAAARLEVDRNEMAVGEITTVHLKGAPLIAVVDWKVSPELEIVDADKKRARVRGVRAGAGSVKCEMNLSIHSINITVRGVAAAAPPPAAPVATPVQAPQPAYSAPTSTTPSYPAPASASPQASLAGTWQINANGYPGRLELSHTQNMLSGRVWFDANAAWEPLEDLYFDEAIGELSFTRPNANQAYRGHLQGNTLEGRFTQWGGRDYSASAPTYSWSANRSGPVAAEPAATAALRPARISEFTWQGMNEDKVGDWGNGRPNGTPDGRLRLTLELPDRQAVSSISLWSATEKGDKAGGQVWHSRNGSYWMLGVFRDGRQINASHVASLGEFSGGTAFDLYANSSGWFNPGQSFLVEVETGDGKVARQILRLGAALPPAPVATGGNQRLKLVDAIPSTSSDVFRRNQRPDLTMHTGSWDRTPYFMAPPREFNLDLSRVDRACLAGDAQGKSNWRVDNYLLFELFDASGTPLGAGVVGGHEGVSQNGRRLPELGPVSHEHAACSVDLKAFLPQGRPFRLKVSAMDYGGVGHASDVWLLLDGQGTSAGGAATASASLSLNRDHSGGHYAPGEAIVVNFTAPAGYASDAWIGIIPSQVPHGSEAENDRHDLTYQYIQKRASGSMSFIAPAAPGNYDLRMHDSDNNGKEVASVSFQVGTVPNAGGRGYTAGRPSAGPAPGADDSLNDVMKQLKGLFGR
jgi:hypothetical protein